jgi:hypothetical protein
MDHPSSAAWPARLCKKRKVRADQAEKRARCGVQGSGPNLSIGYGRRGRTDAGGEVQAMSPLYW